MAGRQALAAILQGKVANESDGTHMVWKKGRQRWPIEATQFTRAIARWMGQQACQRSQAPKRGLGQVVHHPCQNQNVKVKIKAKYGTKRKREPELYMARLEACSIYSSDT
jgi:hypothetical protein